MDESTRVIRTIMKADLITGINVLKPFTIIKTERYNEARSKKTEINVSMGMIETALCIPQESKYSTHIFLRIGFEFDYFPLVPISDLVKLEERGMIKIIKEK